jgi:hypothetical protein
MRIKRRSFPGKHHSSTPARSSAKCTRGRKVPHLQRGMNNLRVRMAWAKNEREHKERLSLGGKEGRGHQLGPLLVNKFKSACEHRSSHTHTPSGRLVEQIADEVESRPPERAGGKKIRALRLFCVSLGNSFYKPEDTRRDNFQNYTSRPPGLKSATARIHLRAPENTYIYIYIAARTFAHFIPRCEELRVVI